jgi:nucleotide-binding universal stress UspA family protein
VALGIALNARGALEIVVATVGLSIGVLNRESYGVIVVMAIVTSLAAPPLLRLVLAGWAGTPEEQLRLESEQSARRRLVASSRPPLLLTRGRPPSLLASQLLDLAWDPGGPVTVWSTVERAGLLPVMDNLAGRTIRLVSRRNGDEAQAILAEADRGHGAIVIGLSDRLDGQPFSPLVEAILADSPVPVVLVRTERISGRPLPSAFARAMVPVTGSIPSRAALEIATGVAARLGTELVLVHLDPAPVLPLPFGRQPPSIPLGMAEPLLRSAAGTARDAGAGTVSTLARTAEAVPAELVRLTVEREIDLLVLGATRRDTGEGSYLGPVAVHALNVCPCTVAVVVTPPGWVGWSQH